MPSVQIEWYRASSRDEVSAFIRRHPDGLAYHMPAWREAVSEAYGGSDVSLIARNASGAIVGFLPLWMRRTSWGGTITSAPFAHYANPLMSSLLGTSGDAGDDVPSFLEASVRAVSEAYRSARLVLKGFVDKGDLGVIDEVHSQYQLDLDAGPDAVWKRASAKARNQKKKADKHGLAVTKEEGTLRIFYDIYLEAMHLHGTPCHARRFFEVLAERFGADCEIHVAWSSRHVPIAAQIAIRCGGTMSYPWQSSVRAYREHCPNDCLMWSLIERSAELRCEAIDMGRSERNSSQSHFKEKWGGRERRLCVWQVPDGKVAGDPGDLARHIWRNLPQWAARKLGPAIRMRFP